jgi:hypothetical protein
MARIRFDFESLALRAERLDTPTARAIAEALPLEARAMTWPSACRWSARARSFAAWLAHLPAVGDFG